MGQVEPLQLVPEQEECNGDLTPSERSFVRMFRVVMFLWEGMFGVCAATRLDKLMGLCAQASGASGAAGLYARQAGICWSACCFMGLILNPLFASISDTVGRKPVVCLTRCGLSLWFLSAQMCSSVKGMMLGEIVGWGGFGVTLTVQNAAFDDVFGDRPQLASELKAKIGGTTGLGGFLGPILGIFLNRRSHRGGSEAAAAKALAFCIPAALCYAQAAVFAVAQPETLSPAKRKKFQLATANPLASVTILLRSGPALRRLTLAACSYCACTSIWGTLDPFRMSALGWTAAENSVFTSCLFLTSAISQALFIPVILRSFGNLRAFQLWSMVAGSAYFCIGQAGRPFGASKLRKSVQYLCPALVLQDPWTDLCSHAIRALVIKEGIDSTEAGRGELSAAFDGITDVVGCVMPMVWGQLFNVLAMHAVTGAAASAAAQSGAGGLWSALARFLGIGGHFMLAGLLRLVSGTIALSIPSRMSAYTSTHDDHDLHAGDTRGGGSAAGSARRGGSGKKMRRIGSMERVPSLGDVRSGRRSGSGDLISPRFAGED